MATISYEAEDRHDGRDYKFTIPQLEAPVCRSCQQMVVTEKVDDQMNTALRAHLNLLSPEEIRAGLERLAITQKEAAESLGIAEETLSRWLNHLQMQTRAMDKLLRVFFQYPQILRALNGKAHAKAEVAEPSKVGAGELPRSIDL